MPDRYREPLRYENRCLRTLTGKLLFGPAGNRLAVDVLDRKPGFSGTIDFIHKMNITQLFTVRDHMEAGCEEAEVMWYPAYMEMHYERGGVSYQEKKTITSDDTAVSAMVWENHARRELVLDFCCETEGFQISETAETAESCVCYLARSPKLRFGITIGIAAGWNHPGKQVVVPAGGRVELLAAAAVGNLAVETQAELRERADGYLCRNQRPMELLESLIREQERFFEEAPSFVCDDKRMNACWDYRWYILKNSMCRPGYGVFPEMVMYEGRDHRMAKTPLEPKGWEFSKLIPLSTPLQVSDLRWHPDRSVTREIIRSAFAAQNEDGLLLCAYVETAHKSYANYMIWAIWLFYLLDGDKEFIRELVPGMKRYISGHEKEYLDGKDGLLIERTHSLTGKEYQPSYWYFHDYPKNPRDPQGYTPLKRVDRSVYHYLNLCGLSRLLRAIEDEAYQVYEEKAEVLKREINDDMWDEETGFYYDLHYLTKEKAMVRNLTGIYPFWADMEEEGYDRGILPLMDPKAFDTGSAFPSVSQDCPAFSPDGGWMGNYIKGRNGCVWCGPSWPYTTGIALEALAAQSRKHGHCFDWQFDRYLKEYTMQHFRDGDYRRPYLVEHYNPVTGERLSDEADYNHSFWLDIVITCVAGIAVKEDCIEINPLRTHLTWFELDNLDIRGHKIRVVFESEELSVFVDGERFIKAEGEEVITIKL